MSAPDIPTGDLANVDLSALDLSDQSQWAIYMPKKRQGDDLEDLQKKKQKLFDEVDKAKKAIKSHGTFNGAFYRKASRAESLTLDKLRVMSEISFSNFSGDYSAWSNEETTKTLFSKIKAAEYRTKLFEARSKALAADKKKRGGRFRSLFMRMFTSSRIGLDINTGEGERDSSKQKNFRTALIREYNSTKPGTDNRLWCPILGSFFDEDAMIAAHIFSHKHGQEMMDGIFGKIRPSEMFSSKNGMMIHKTIENHFDNGLFVVVPDIPDMFSVDGVMAWLTGDIREYKVRIIDLAWKKLDQSIFAEGTKPTWRDLDGKRLVFRSNARPAARYLYFHYCLQLLRRAWRTSKDKQKGHLSVGQAQADTLFDEFGKHVWATPGRYIGRKMLKSLVDTLGHEYDELLRGASSMNVSDPDAFMACLTGQISDTPSPDEEIDDEMDLDQD